MRIGAILRGCVMLKLVSVALLFNTTSCTSPLGDLDRRARTVMAEEMRRLGVEDATPSFDHMEPRRAMANGERETPAEDGYTYRPSTTNPNADALEFEQADPARDVAQILMRYTAEPGTYQRFDLNQTLEYAVGHSREYLTAKEELLLASLRLLVARHLFDVLFFNDISASFDADAEDGDYDSAVRLINEFRMTRRLRSGGDVSARALVQATEQLRSQVASNDTQSASVVLSANLPLLRGAGRVAEESLISAERELVYATRTFERFRRQFLFDIATDYFDLVQTIRQIENAERVLERRQALFDDTQKLVDAGRRAPFELGEAEQRVLTGQNSLASQRDRYVLQLERFRVRLGMPPDQPFFIDETAAFNLPIPELDMTESVRRGLSYRLDLQTTRDRLDDAYRGLSNARNDLLPDLDLSASMTAITDPDDDRPGLGLELDETDFTTSVTFGLPLDREDERIALRQAQISLERAVRNLEEREDEVAIDIRSAIRGLELAIFSLDLQIRNIGSIRQRIDGLERRRDVSNRSKIDAYDDLAAALDAREQARRDLRVAVLRYLLSTGQFRVDTNGRFEAPSGLELLGPDEGGEWYQRLFSDEEPLPINPVNLIDPEDLRDPNAPPAGEPDPVPNEG